MKNNLFFPNTAADNSEKSVEQMIIESIAGIYTSMYLINIPDNTHEELNTISEMREFTSQFKNASDQILEAAANLVDDDALEEAMAFFDISTLNERMRDTDVVGAEFHSKIGHWYRANFIAVSRDAERNLIYVLHVIRTIDREKYHEIEYKRMLQETMEKQASLYSEMLHIQGCALIASSAETGEVIVMNSAAIELFGLEEKDNYYHKLFDRVVVEDKEAMRRLFCRNMKESERQNYEFAVRRPDGELVYVMSDVRVAVLRNGEKVMINSMVDITEKKKLENKLRMLSETDALTRINNRRSGDIQIESLLANGRKGMYCLLDIDKFKAINDTFGHAVGDKALIETAKCMRKSFRNSDVIMRLGGDEFAAFVVGMESEEQGSVLIERFFNEIAQISIEEMDGRKMYVSVGAVLCDGSKICYEQIYSMADSAMYITKNEAGNTYRFYHEK